MMGKFFSFAGQSLSLLVLYILYSLLAALGVAYVLVTTSFQIRPITLLVLGILAWAAASQGLSFFTDYVLSLELSVYLWTYLCIGFWEAVLVIPVCSCILLIQGLISDSNNRSIGYVLKKVSNIFVLGVSLYSAALASRTRGFLWRGIRPDLCVPRSGSPMVFASRIRAFRLGAQTVFRPGQASRPSVVSRPEAERDQFNASPGSFA
ncbi:MAG: hypothetical protein P8018_09655 [Acidobacteriota bacterium]